MHVIAECSKTAADLTKTPHSLLRTCVGPQLLPTPLLRPATCQWRLRRKAETNKQAKPDGQAALLAHPRHWQKLPRPWLQQTIKERDRPDGSPGLLTGKSDAREAAMMLQGALHSWPVSLLLLESFFTSASTALLPLLLPGGLASCNRLPTSEPSRSPHISNRGMRSMHCILIKASMPSVTTHWLVYTFLALHPW